MKLIVQTMRKIKVDIDKRVGKDQYYLNIAKAVANRSTCLIRKYGAVIVNNDEIISTGYNGSPRGGFNCSDNKVCQRKTFRGEVHNTGYEFCQSVHAEMNAIISAQRKDMNGSTIYLYCYDLENNKEIKPMPCPICERMIINSGIQRLVTWEV